jgi:hypothetical protein
MIGHLKLLTSILISWLKSRGRLEAEVEHHEPLLARATRRQLGAVSGDLGAVLQKVGAISQFHPDGRRAMRRAKLGDTSWSFLASSS